MFVPSTNTTGERDVALTPSRMVVTTIESAAGEVVEYLQEVLRYSAIETDIAPIAIAAVTFRKPRYPRDTRLLARPPSSAALRVRRR